jgi:dihydrodipicolinate synthase/N-acetylneuraminate lyase
MGVDGFISALANIYPATFARIWNGAEAAQAAIDRVRTAVKGYGGIGGLKVLLRTRGFDFGGTRLPFADLAPEEERELLSTVEGLGELD